MKATANPLKKLEALGQSLWLDYISRDLIKSGKLKKMIDEDGLRGMTSNPAIFEKSITESHDYDEDIQSLTKKNKSKIEIYEFLSQKDVQLAADVFRPLYDKLHGKDGFVSLEVNPHLANDTHKTIEEARHLWKIVGRPNVFIKVPGTKEGLPAISQLISEGINVNVTLLFGLPRYKQVANAYIEGIERRLAHGLSVENISSVASFFLSRIDTLADPILEKIASQGGEKGELAKKIIGEIAIASAKEAHKIFKEIFESERFKKLSAKNARIQRLLWASTSTKNPKYSDTKYVDPLIWPDTINTMPLETINAYRDHGDPKLTLENDSSHASWVMQQLPKLGLDIDQITQQLEDEGVEKFNKPFDKLLKALEGI